MSKYQNETLRIYKSEKSARRARIAYTARYHRECSDIFKHVITDKRVKDKMRYALIVDAQLLTTQ